MYNCCEWHQLHTYQQQYCREHIFLAMGLNRDAGINPIYQQYCYATNSITLFSFKKLKCCKKEIIHSWMISSSVQTSVQHSKHKSSWVFKLLSFKWYASLLQQVAVSKVLMDSKYMLLRLSLKLFLYPIDLFRLFFFSKSFFLLIRFYDSKVGLYCLKINRRLLHLHQSCQTLSYNHLNLNQKWMYWSAVKKIN